MELETAHATPHRRDRRQLAMPAGRYTLVAVAHSVAELVAMAGGLLCERALSGWTVTAVIGDGIDVTPLTILGAEIYCAPSDPQPPSKRISPHALVISSRLLDTGRCTHPDLLVHYDFRESEALVFGEELVVGPADDSMRLQLSSASRAFKGHAQAAAGRPVSRVEPTETFVHSPSLPQFKVRPPRN